MSSSAAIGYVQTMVETENWQKLCPSEPEYCPGVVEVGKELVQCPAADTTCPYRAARRVEEQVRHLEGLNFPVDARRSELKRVPEDIREGVRLYLDNIAEWVERGEGFFVLGDVGIGKTCILALVALAARDADVGAVNFVHSASLFNALHEKRAEEYTEAALLLIDDYGVEYGADWPMAGFHLLMEQRHAFRLATCLTSNAGADKLTKDPGIMRILARLRERNVWLESKAETQREDLTLDAWRSSKGASH